MILEKFCILDLETTGTDTEKDRICEIAVIRFNPYREEKCLRINPGVPIPEGASKIHGITDDLVKNCPAFKQIAKSLLDFITGCNILGFNSNTFDIRILYNEFIRAGVIWNAKAVKWIDACSIFKQKEERTLSAALKFYCNETHEDAHGSLADCKATEKVFEAQLKKYEDVRHLDLTGLALLSNYNKKIVDISGKFTMNDTGQIVFNFGQHKGKIATSEKQYLSWMLNKGDFAPDTKGVAHALLYDQMPGK